MKVRLTSEILVACSNGNCSSGIVQREQGRVSGGDFKLLPEETEDRPPRTPTASMQSRRAWAKWKRFVGIRSLRTGECRCPRLRDRSPGNVNQPSAHRDPKGETVVVRR